jgi:hypothetical protein
MKSRLITKQDITQYARPCNADDALVNRCIEEAELFDLRVNIGDELYMELQDAIKKHQYGTFTDTFDESFDRASRIAFLYSGGKYQDRDGAWHMFIGVRSALCYYAYARIVRSGSGTQTRFGYVSKEDSYSSHASAADRVQAYNGAFELADAYMIEARRFIREMCPELQQRPMKNNRVKLHVIGK